MNKTEHTASAPINKLRQELIQIIPSERIYTDALRRMAWGTDASVYRMIPQLVIRSKREQEIVGILQAASRRHIPITFRAAGTSLSGQSVSDSVLVVAGKNWEDYSLNNDATLITAEPGLTGGRINEILKPFGRKFAPDPASIKSAMLGGIVMNNASGMSCGTHANSDKIMVSARIILSDGTILDTADAASRKSFTEGHPGFVKTILSIRQQILSDKSILDRLKKKYQIKNVTGLNLSPFLRFEDPFDIIAHLMTGSEGTLAFLSKATFKTEPIKPFQASALICFNSLREACVAVQTIKPLAPAAVELLDRKALHSIEHLSNIPSYIATLGQDATALLIEAQADTMQELHQQIERIEKGLQPFKILNDYHFTTQPEEYAPLWNIRSGIFPACGGMRQSGTSCLIEDIAFPIEHLADATVELQQILNKYAYDDSVIYGHALEGNFHFILNQRFDTAKEVRRYESMMKEVVNMVVHQYDGSLKAEHGTGRNMAPFVEEEWGKPIWDLMKKVKELFDPLNILNPGVIFNDDPDCFLKNLKTIPQASPLIDKCIECGFCEINCVTAGLTLSARQRIAVFRELTRIKDIPGQSARYREILHDFRYAGEQTCAGDGLCATSCPMGINTGELIHAARQQRNQHIPLSNTFGEWSAVHFATVKNGMRSLLYTADTVHRIVGSKAMNAMSQSIHRFSNGLIPLWNEAIPRPIHQIGSNNKNQITADKVVYFPSCINQTFAASAPNDTPLIDTFQRLLHRAGYEVIFPKQMSKLCCGMIWESKGLPDIADKKTAELEEALAEASLQGKYPIVCDQSPCLYRMRKHFKNIHVYETAEFINKYVMQRLTIYRQKEQIALHLTCSTRKLNLNEQLISLAQKCCKHVFIPEEIGCCGFAGDKGFTHPEVNQYALRKLKQQLDKNHITEGYSNSRTCEIGLTANAGVSYKSIVYLVDECTNTNTSEHD